MVFENASARLKLNVYESGINTRIKVTSDIGKH
jgi:hypothetical protein